MCLPREGVGTFINKLLSPEWQRYITESYNMGPTLQDVQPSASFSEAMPKQGDSVLVDEEYMNLNIGKWVGEVQRNGRQVSGMIAAGAACQSRECAILGPEIDDRTAGDLGNMEVVILADHQIQRGQLPAELRLAAHKAIDIVQVFPAVRREPARLVAGLRAS